MHPTPHVHGHIHENDFAVRCCCLHVSLHRGRQVHVPFPGTQEAGHQQQPGQDWDVIGWTMIGGGLLQWKKYYHIAEDFMNRFVCFSFQKPDLLELVNDNHIEVICF